MSMIFPGTDPYLEDPQIWPGLHAALVVYIRNHLQPLLRPRYIAAIEERVFVEGPDRDIIPDVWLKRARSDQPRPGVALAESDAPVVVRVPTLEIHETYVTILDRQSGLRVVTVIEVVSPTNKHPGPGRKSYLSKQQEVLELWSEGFCYRDISAITGHAENYVRVLAHRALEAIRRHPRMLKGLGMLEA